MKTERFPFPKQWQDKKLKPQRESPPMKETSFAGIDPYK